MFISTMSQLLKKLEGGDRRSIGRVVEVVSEVSNNTALIEDLIDGLFVVDRLLVDNFDQCPFQ